MRSHAVVGVPVGMCGLGVVIGISAGVGSFGGAGFEFGTSSGGVVTSNICVVNLLDINYFS